jgi:hypothetical protein
MKMDNTTHGKAIAFLSEKARKRFPKWNVQPPLLAWKLEVEPSRPRFWDILSMF